MVRTRHYVGVSTKTSDLTEAGFTLQELVARSGVSAPTVHQYRRLGLLPEPGRSAPNRFLYDERHVLALRLIRELRDRNNLPLDVIGQLLPGLLNNAPKITGSLEFDDVVLAHLRAVDPARPPSRLLAAARDAFARHGYEEVSVGDICVAAGLAKGSFYRYFSSKEEAFLAAVASMVDVIGDDFRSRAGTVDADHAIDELRDFLIPLVPLFLEVVLRALHGQPGHAEVVANVINGLSEQVAHRAGVPSDQVEEEGSRLAEAALARLLRARFEPDIS